MIKRLDHLNFSVDNLDESIAWYQRVFDFEMVEDGVRNGKPWAILKSNDAMLAMYERTGAQFLNSEKQVEQNFHGIAHIGMAISNEEDWLSRIDQENILIDHTWDYPHSKSWYLNDPTGHEIEVVLWGDGIRFG